MSQRWESTPLSRRELWEIVRDLVDTQGLTVLLSTAYLDEAERCGHVIVLHQGKVLAQGRPSDITAIARGHVFVAELAPGQSARGVQSRLLDEPDVIDAVPDGGRVRIVRAAAAKAGTVAPVLEGARISPVLPRFEDGFMSLLRRVADQEHASAISLDRPLASSETEVAVHVHKPCPKIRGVHGRRPHQLRRAPRRDLRPVGSQRRRQNYNLPNALRPVARDGWGPARGRRGRAQLAR